MADDDTLHPDELTDLFQNVRYESPESDSRYVMHLEHRRSMVFLVITGIVLQATPEEFITRVEGILKRLKQAALVIDLRTCEYLSSSALGYLIRFFDSAIHGRSQIVLLQPKPKITNVIRLLGFDQMFLTIDDEDTAYAFFKQQGLLS
jgi:anti-anti-sigma factor